MFQTGGLTLLSFVITFIVATIVIYTLFLTWYFLQETDWQQSITILSNSNDSNNQWGI